MDGLTLIFGKPQTGKTVRLVHELREADRVVLVDPKCGQLAKLRNWHHVWPVFDSKQKRWTDSSVSNCFRKHLSGPFRVIVHFRFDHRSQLELLSRVVMTVRRCVLAVDELGLFVPPGPAGALPRSITSVAVSGTHDGVYFIGTAQRPSLVHSIIRANANRMLFYRMTEPADVKVAGNYLGSAFDVASLPDQVCVDWRDGRDPFVDRDLAGKLGRLLPKREAVV